LAGRKEPCRLYESGQLRRVTGDTIRPGGFKLTERALAVCSFPPGARVLDVGCGSGATVKYLIDRHNLAAVGVDPSAMLLAEGLRRRPGLPLVPGRGENLPFADGRMDGVFAECTLSVMEDAGRALREFHRVLKPDGMLAVADVYVREPLAARALRHLRPEGCLTGALSWEELTAKITAAGFKILLWEDHSRLLAELAARLILADIPLAALGGNQPDIRSAIKNARPGYLLIIARKPG